MDRRQCIDRFHLHDHDPVDHQIDTIPGLEFDGFIDDGKRHLPEHRVAAAFQFMRKANFGG